MPEISTDQAADSLQVSPLAKQLAAAAERAAARDSQLSRKELAALALRISIHLGGNAYISNKALYDAIVPETDDPELLARARQATDFSNGKDTNPFKDLTTEQLALISYDEAGEFTHNERYAANWELGLRASQWTAYIVEKSTSEYQRSGSREMAIREMSDYYRSLPPIIGAEFDGFELHAMLDKEGAELPRTRTSMFLFDTVLQTTLELEQQAGEAKPPLTPPAQDPSKQQ
ncbi:MAG TPA: hypothetical protein DCE25_02215 [Pseudomonas sp.]|nr:hypothetical protein [Pseudomonas sp.]